MPVSAITAGFVAVLVGYASSAAIVFQAAVAVGANSAQISSWMMVLGFGMGITCIALSLRYRAPIITAWSTPGAALLATSLVGVELPDAIAAFLFSAALSTLVGVTGWFEKAMARVPLQIASAMLAGLLVRFGMDVFIAMQDQVLMVLPMFVAYLMLKRYSPRFVIIIVFFLGIAFAAALGLLRFDEVSFQIAQPVFTMPTLNVPVLISVGVPLFIVTMASQNIPGAAVLRAFGYGCVPVSALITSTGLMTLLMAPFGGFSYNLAAITAAICAGPEAHIDPRKRYLAGVSAGVFYLLTGLFGATIATAFIAFPSALVMAIAGIALIGTMTTSLKQAMGESTWREPALITFLVTLSGVTLFGVGSAFWGLVAGALAMLLLGPGEDNERPGN
ncbi:MAG: benzoate membrane transport protein [Gammaproteobacteria bacterium]|jgi:benzoate membrane transport protein